MDAVSRTIQANVGLVHAVVQRGLRISQKDNDYEDAVAGGMYGLWQATLYFREDGGARFSTYAAKLIYRDAIRVVRRLRRYGFRGTNSRPVRNPACGWSGRSSEREKGGWPIDVMALIESPEKENVDLGDPDIRRRVKECISNLSPDESIVIEGLYFGGKTLQQVGDEVGITREGVRQRQKRALRKLRRMIDPPPVPVNEFCFPGQMNCKGCGKAMVSARGLRYCRMPCLSPSRKLKQRGIVL